MGQPYVGEIRLFAGNFAPSGWNFCDGSLLSISEYSTIFNLIGTTYGGDGQTTFAVPDLRGRVPLHVGGGYVIGQLGGEQTVTVTTNQIPAHTHVPLAASGGSNNPSDSPTNNYWSEWTGGQYASTAPSVNMDPSAIGQAGGSQPHDNMVPYVAISYIISLFGVYPSQT